MKVSKCAKVCESYEVINFTDFLGEIRRNTPSKNTLATLYETLLEFTNFFK